MFNVKQTHRANKNAARAFCFMLKARKKQERTFWRNAWLFYSYESFNWWWRN